MTDKPQPIRWPAEAIWQAVEPALPGFTVEVLPEIDSTNTELMRRFRGGPGMPPQAEPVLLVAERQTAGRGRLGRNWHSKRGASLTFSLGLALEPVHWSGLSLVVGISLAESLDPTGSLVGLKWPNDVWLRASGTSQRQGQAPQPERKLAGILVETANRGDQRYVVIGVGINIEPLELDAALASNALAAAVPPGCMQHIDPALDAPATLMAVLPNLVSNVQAFAQFGFAPFQARFARRDVLAGRTVQIVGDAAGLAGEACGVSESGVLLVHTAAGMKEVTSSEVSVRPVSGNGVAAVAAQPGGSGPC